MAKNWVWAIPLGVVLILLQLWIYTQVPSWREQIIVYILFTAFVFSFGSWRTEKALFKVSFLKAIPKMLLFAGLTFAILYGSQILIKGGSPPVIAEALNSVPISLILIHGFIVAVDEELVFRGWLLETLKNRGLKRSYVFIITSATFALFHFFMAGRSWILILPYIVLGYLFAYIKEKYSPETNMSNIGVHFSWNLFILAFSELLK